MLISSAWGTNPPIYLQTDSNAVNLGLTSIFFWNDESEDVSLLSEAELSIVEVRFVSMLSIIFSFI